MQVQCSVAKLDSGHLNTLVATMPSSGDFGEAAEEERAADGASRNLDNRVAEKRLKRLKYARCAVVGTKLSVLAVLVAILLGQASHNKVSPFKVQPVC